MCFSSPHISRLISSPSITRTKCALKRRCMRSMLIRLALWSLRRAPQRVGGRSGKPWVISGGTRALHSSGNLFVTVSQQPGMWRMCGGGCQIHPIESSLMRVIMKEKRGDKLLLRQDRKCPSIDHIPGLVLVGVSRGFVALLAFCRRSSSGRRIAVFKAPQPRGSGGVKWFGRLPFVVREISGCFSCRVSCSS